jgi:prepilin-type N-terminal cleavage/methylation domain-containing protein
MKQNKFQKGFTLIELLITIAVAGVLVTLGLSTYVSSQKASRDARRKSDLKQYQTALENYANRSGSLYPIAAAAVDVSTLCATLGISGTCPTDPNSGLYSYLTDNLGLTYVLWGTLEKPTTTTYWVICSTGSSGTTTTVPGSATCPSLTP